MAVSLFGVDSKDTTIRNVFINQRRFVLFNSRWISGECLSTCNNQSTSPTTFPTENLIKNPTIDRTRTPSGTSVEKTTSDPTKSPTENPTKTPAVLLTNVPTDAPANPSIFRTDQPTANPTTASAKISTIEFTGYPTTKPTMEATEFPTGKSNIPTNQPTIEEPTENPTTEPTKVPTKNPTTDPIYSPTDSPTIVPTNQQTTNISTSYPTIRPTRFPTQNPTIDVTKLPIDAPTNVRTTQPTTKEPTENPTIEPIESPTKNPTIQPTKTPTETPTKGPTSNPTSGPTTKEPTNRPTGSPTKNPTIEPTESPTKIPTVQPTKLGTKTPTKEPTSNPTSQPTTKEPTNRPTRLPTKNPTHEPTETPTRLPTEVPTTRPTKTSMTPPTIEASAPSDYECAWPRAQFSAITKGDLTSAAHNVYKALGVGGALRNPSSSHSTIDGKVYHFKGFEGRFNFNKGTEKINDWDDIPIDYAQYQWLARNMKSSDINGKKVIVKTTGKDGSRNGCYDLYDFRPGGQGYDNGNTLVVFNTNDDICLTGTTDGRQFGPSVLAPFSKVTLTRAGFIDGIVIAKSFTTVSGSNLGSDLQLHGVNYNGSIECIERALPSPTAKPVSALYPPKENCNCGKGTTDLDQSWRCGKAIYVCPNMDTVCSNQGGKKSKYYALTQDQCDTMKNVDIGEKCISLPQYGLEKRKRLTDRVCYTAEMNNSLGMKNDGESCNVCEDSISPVFER